MRGKFFRSNSGRVANRSRHQSRAPLSRLGASPGCGPALQRRTGSSGKTAHSAKTPHGEYDSQSAKPPSNFVGPSPPRRVSNLAGFSLVEIVVGLVLLASLAVGAIMATKTHSQQIAAARKRMAAVKVADTLLQQWSEFEVPVNQQGPVPGQPDWIWRTQIVATRPAKQFTGQIVRLQILDASKNNSELVSTDIFQLESP